MAAEKKSPTYGEMRTNAEKIFDARVKQRVLAGIEALKEEYGEDFAYYITPETLDMQSGSACMVGQMLKAFPEQDVQNRKILNMSQSLGFDTYSETYDDLQKAWLIALGKK